MTTQLRHRYFLQRCPTTASAATRPTAPPKLSTKKVQLSTTRISTASCAHILYRHTAEHHISAQTQTSRPSIE